MKITILALLFLAALTCVACDKDAERAKIICMINGTPCPGSPVK